MTEFTVRTIHLDQERVEVQTLELAPDNEQGEAVCDLFREFLAGKSTQFREHLPFLQKVHMELEWAAGDGGTALASFYDDHEPLSMGILLSGLDAEADSQMLDLLRQAVFEPVFGERSHEWVEAPERPLLLNVIFPGRPELTPRAQLLGAALSSVFFRVVKAQRGADHRL